MLLHAFGTDPQQASTASHDQTARSAITTAEEATDSSDAMRRTLLVTRHIHIQSGRIRR
jgi:hypothetical protein